jgi:hypothetical protein
MASKNFHVVTNTQLLIGAITAGLFSAASVVLTYLYITSFNKPKVVFGPDKACVKVINYQNGDAFQCDDVDVTLRRYQREQE